MRASTGQFCQHCNAWRGSLGLEPTPALYVAHIVEVMREVKRVLRDDGTVFMNLGDSYFGDSPTRKRSSEAFSKEWDKSQTASRGGLRRSAASINGLKPKDLVGIPWQVAFALRDDGWWLRSDIIWHKPNCMPESVTDRPTKSHEYLFLLSKSARYYYDLEAIREAPAPHNKAAQGKPQWFPKAGPNRIYGTKEQNITQYDRVCGRNRRTVWTIPTESYRGAHFATFPRKLVEPCILAGTSAKGCCPVCGAGWVRVVERTGHVNQREPAHAPNNSPTKTDSTGWKATTVATDKWQPTCDHDEEPIPCTVLDPFCGTATVGEVALQLNRSFIGIELSEDYIELARRRLHGTQLGLPMAL